MKVTPTLTIQTEDKQIIVVADSSPQVKEMVGYIDEWRQQEMDLTSQLLMVKSALRDIQNVLSQQLAAEAREKAAVNDAASNEVVSEN